MEEKPEIKYRLGWISISILVILALIADLIGVIPVAESISGTIYWGIAAIILWMRGCGLLNWRRFVTSGISLAAGWIPAIQFLPQITIGIIIVIIITRTEDKTGISIAKTATKGVTPARGVRKPVNSTPGVRPPRLPKNPEVQS